MKNVQVRVLVVAELANNTLDCFISQIVKSELTYVYILRSKPGVLHERVTYICPPSTLRGNHFLIFIWKLLYSLRLVLNFKFSCVYAIFAYPHLYLASLMAFLTRKPLVYTIIASRFELIGRNTVFQKLTISLARRASKIIVSGFGVKEHLVRHGIQSKNIVKYSILELVNLDGFVPLGLEKSIDLVVLSRLVQGKNIETFIDIVASLKEEKPSIKAAIIGDGKSKEDLERYANSLGLSDNIKFYGYVQSVVEVNRILNYAKIFVLNSSHEGGPFTVPEAMAAGLCVVSSDVGEVRSIIKHGQNGFIVERYNDLEAYLNIIKELLGNPRQLEEIQQRAKEIKNRRTNTSLREFWKKTISRVQQS